MHARSENAGRFGIGALVLLLLLTVVIRLPLLAEPWGGDQAGFGYVAKGILEGKVPYRDIYSLTAYGVFFTFALFFKLFGMTMVSAHIGHILVSCITLILVCLLARRVYGGYAAWIAGLSYTIFANGLAFSGFGYENRSAWGTYWYLAQREVFMAPLLLGAVFLLILRTRRNAPWVDLANGLLIGLAAFYKLTALLMLLLFALLSVREEFRGTAGARFRRSVLSLFLLVLGFVVVQLPFLYYFWINQALGDVYQALFVHLANYARLSRGLRIETFFSGHYSVMRENLVLWLFALVSLQQILTRDRTRENMLIALWCLASLAMVWGQGKFFGYHFILLVPPFAVLAGYGLPRFLGSAGSGAGSWIRGAGELPKAFLLSALLYSVAAFGIQNYDYYRHHLAYGLGKISQRAYYDVFTEFPTHPYSFRADYDVVRYLQEEARPGERLGVVFSAGDSVIHFLTGLEPVTRFLQSWYLFPSDPALAVNPLTVKLRHELIETMIRTAPRFLLCVHIPLEELAKGPGLEGDSEMARFLEFVHAHYRLKRFPDHRFLFVRI